MGMSVAAKRQDQRIGDLGALGAVARLSISGLEERHQHESAGLLHRAGADDTVRAATGKYDRRAAAARIPERRGADHPLADLELVVGRDHVDMVGLELELLVADLDDRHPGPSAENGRQLTLVVGRQMDDDNVDEPEIDGRRVEERTQRFDTARGCTPMPTTVIRGALTDSWL
jgi:hypothetical protein